MSAHATPENRPIGTANPYEALPDRAFWRPAVADRDPLDIAELWKPKYHIQPDQNVVTAGSCFAQHIGRVLRDHGYAWHDAEPGPTHLSDENLRRYGYGAFSFRTGNVYTVAQLKQWLSWALRPTPVPTEVWESAGRFRDPFRPNIEPEGFESVDELVASRQATLSSISSAVSRASVFVFTMGLTEGWENAELDYSYAACPGTLAGTYDEAIHVFRRYTYPQILGDLQRCIRMLRRRNPKLRILLTVSPVPLTATASGEHVLCATTYSKSVLRAVAGTITNSDEFAEFVDYFPSYEMITCTPFRGMFFEPNMRSVSKRGVQFVMNTFFECLTGSAEATRRVVPTSPAKDPDKEDDDVVCDEELLNAFAPKA